MYRQAVGRKLRPGIVLAALVTAGALTSSFHPPALRAQSRPTGFAGIAGQTDTDLEGDFEVQFEDSASGAKLHHFLKVGNQKIRLLFANDDAPKYETGTKVRARGRLQNGTLALSGKSSVEALSLASSNTFGVQKTVVLLVNFQDNPATPYSTSAASATTFQTVSDYFREASFNQTSLTGDVVGWYTIPLSSGSCDYDQIGNQAEQAATAHGVNLEQYTRRIYAFPQTGACSWWGLAYLGGNPSRAWVNGTYALHVVAHELGHGFGLYHSHSQSCDTGGCGASDYGDTHDVMGNIFAGHFNAFQKERLGWLNYGSSPPLQTVTASGTYWVDAAETQTSYPKALRILKSNIGGTRTWYYIENRAPIGFDNGAAAGVVIHTGSESSGDTSYEIDMTPTSSGYDAVLDPGQTFSDSAIGLTVVTVQSGTSGASVDISLPGGTPTPCTAAAPGFSATPSSTVQTNPNVPVSYLISIQNKDNSSCAPSDFALGAGVPSGWSVSYGAPSILVAPGTTGTATVAVTPPGSASGTFSITLSSSRSTGPGASTSRSIDVISTPPPPPPPPTSISVGLSIGSSNPYQFTATVSGGGSPVSGAGLEFVVRNPKGAVTSLSATTNGEGVASVKLRLKPRDPRGAYLVTATATSHSVSGTATGGFVYESAANFKLRTLN